MGAHLPVRSRDRHTKALAAELRRRLIERRRADAAAGRTHTEDLPAAIASLVEREAAVLSPPARACIADLILRDTVGLGPLEELMADPRVEELSWP